MRSQRSPCLINAGLSLIKNKIYKNEKRCDKNLNYSDPKYLASIRSFIDRSRRQFFFIRRISLHFNEIMMRSTLFKTNTLSWIFILLAHWNNSPCIDMSLHSGTLFWFRDNQSLLLLLRAACLAEKQQIPINFIVFGLTNRPCLEPTI